MKRIIPLILLLTLSATTMQAQLFKKKEKTIKTEYNIGTIPMVNGKVTFEETIPAKGLSATEIENAVNEWFAERFVKPTVIGFKKYEQEFPNTVIGKSEEYIVFQKKLFVLNRTRISYFLTITCENEQCKFNMSRITYWWDEEAEDGGIKMTAEECITDETAIDKKGRLRRFNGKFRTRTIDLKNTLVEQLKKKLAKTE
jgi:hypothetical protein